MKTIRNITRFTYEFTSFQGWRVTLCRKHVHFTRYFSDKQYGSEEASLAAAISMRDRVLERLHIMPENPEQAFAPFRTEVLVTGYPQGLRPRKSAMADALPATA